MAPTPPLRRGPPRQPATERTATMRTIEHTVDIQAPAATVWQVLTDTDRYQDWNPFMPPAVRPDRPRRAPDDHRPARDAHDDLPAHRARGRRRHAHSLARTARGARPLRRPARAAPRAHPRRWHPLRPA